MKHRIFFLTDGEPKQPPAEVAEPGAPESLDKIYLQAVDGWKQYMLTLAERIIRDSIKETLGAQRNHQPIRSLPPDDCIPIDFVPFLMTTNTTDKELTPIAFSRPKNRRGQYQAAKKKRRGDGRPTPKLTPTWDEDNVQKIFLNGAWSALWQGIRQVWLEHVADDHDNPAGTLIFYFACHGLQTFQAAADAVERIKPTVPQPAYYPHLQTNIANWRIMCAFDTHVQPPPDRNQKSRRHTHFDGSTLRLWLGEGEHDSPQHGRSDVFAFHCRKVVGTFTWECRLPTEHPTREQPGPSPALGSIIVLDPCSSTTLATSTTSTAIPFNGQEAVPAALRQLGITNAVYKEAERFVDMDGYIVVDNKKAILKLRSTLTNAEKWHGLANLVEQLRAAQVASKAPVTDVFTWKLPTDREAIEAEVIEVGR